MSQRQRASRLSRRYTSSGVTRPPVFGYQRTSRFDVPITSDDGPRRAALYIIAAIIMGVIYACAY